MCPTMKSYFNPPKGNNSLFLREARMYLAIFNFSSSKLKSENHIFASQIATPEFRLLSITLLFLFIGVLELGIAYVQILNAEEQGDYQRAQQIAEIEVVLN